jgi:hypothetical protein
MKSIPVRFEVREVAEDCNTCRGTGSVWRNGVGFGSYFECDDCRGKGSTKSKGWQLFALPATGSGWAPIPMTRTPRGTPSGALTEFTSALYKLSEDT